MLKNIQKHLDIKLIKLSAILAFIYCLLFNSAILIYKFDYYKATIFRGILELSKDFCYIYIFSFIAFFGLSIHRLALKIGSCFLFITSAIASYYIYFFKITPTKQVIGSFFSTDLNEVYELTSIKLIIWIVFSLFTCLYTLRTFATSDTKSFITKLLSAACLLIFLYNIITPSFKILKNYFPVQYLHNTYLNFAGSLGGKNHAQIDISKQYNFVDNSDNDIIGVLVIGESARFDHFGINGYMRDTTPRLKNIENLTSFKAKSASNLTYISIPSLLSRYPASKIENSFLSVLTSIGFNTTWIGTQTLMRNFANFDLGTISICSDKIKSDASNCEQLALVNSYDNSILYTDFFLSNLIDLLKDKNAFLLYVSDHGESLGENGYYGHGGPLIAEQTTVPFLVWMSDEFKQNHPESVASIKNYANNEISHDYVFHSILDCLNIDSDVIDKGLSLCKSS